MKTNLITKILFLFLFKNTIDAAYSNKSLTTFLNERYSFVYNKTYSWTTTTKEIIAIRGKCDASTILCLGGIDSRNNKVPILACGNCLTITKNTTLNKPQLNDGVYWYNTPSYSIGFASNSYINQNAADRYAVESDQRLSWHLDRNIGGWRVGSESELNNNTRYYKIALISPFTIPVSGILNDIPMSFFLNKGFSVVYNYQYGHATTSEEINVVRNVCGASKVLCMGGLDSRNNSLLVVACGYCLDVLSLTELNKPQLHDAVYWYNTPSNSIGFAPTANIQQNQADTNDQSSNQRVSWHLDINVGGWRVGSITGLNYDSTYYKIIFMSP
jgi:hypothetical protein